MNQMLVSSPFSWTSDSMLKLESTKSNQIIELSSCDFNTGHSYLIMTHNLSSTNQISLVWQ